MMAPRSRSSGGRYWPDLRWLPLEKEPLAEVAYPDACRSRQTNAPPAVSVRRARRNCPSLRSVERSELLPRDWLAGVPVHRAGQRMFLPFRAATGPALAARRGPVFRWAWWGENQAA